MICINKKMRTGLLIPAFIMILILNSCGQINKDSEIPKEFKKYIARKKVPIDYKEIIPYYGNQHLPIPDFLTTKEALKDIEMFEYLVNTSYSGLEYWEYQGVNFDSYFSELKAFVKQKDTVFIEEFEKEWSKILNQIRDGHIGFVGKESYYAYKHKSVYFCDIVVEKSDSGKFKVINSQFDLVKTGDFFTQKDPNQYLLKTLSPTGKNHYLIGSLSYVPVSSKQLAFNEKTIEVPFCESRLSFAKFNDQSPFYIERKEDIPIVRVSSFRNDIYPVMKKFMESGYQLQKENQIIVNIMNNGGGSSLFPQTFIQNLNGLVQWETYWATLESPPIVEYLAKYDLNSKTAESPNFRDLITNSKEKLTTYQSSPSKNWEFTSVPNENLQGDYMGNLFVLTNRNVLSGGEAFVGTSQSVKNSIIIGENTGGVGQFSSACGYYLPNSKFIVHLPRHFILIPGFEECVGFLPDYWLNTIDPVKETLDWISNPDDYQFTYLNNFKEILSKINFSLVLPGDLVIVPPGSGITENIARFSGKWFGISDGILDNLLVVEEIHNNMEVDAIYAWGTAYQWGINQPGWQRFKGKIENQKLILTNGNVKITYEFRSDGLLNATYKRPGILSNIILTRVE
jgi:hypothetical protein